MVDELVYEVRSNKSKVRISHETATVIASETKQSVKSKKKSKKEVAGKTCPKCKKGQLLKGSNAFGCTEYNKTCDFILPFEFLGKKISENQLLRLLDKNSTTNLKGFTTETGKVEGLVRFDENYKLKLEEKKSNVTSSSVEKFSQSDTITCPKCKKGTVLKGKTAYGCSEYKTGCDFVFTFDNIKKIANGNPLTKDLVVKIISS